MKNETIRTAIMLATPPAGNQGLTRDEIVTEVLWQMGQPMGDGMSGVPKRKSVVDKLRRMINNGEIEAWCDGGITQIA